MAAISSGPAQAGAQQENDWVDEELVSPTAHLWANEIRPKIDDLYTQAPVISDALATTTSDAQDKTIWECLPLLSAEDGETDDYNQYGVPRLHRKNHIQFLRRTLGKLPAPFFMADPSRPWFFYWALNGLSLLGADVSEFRDGLVATARYMQNETGGFGGGFGQLSHLATTYAMVLALAIVGGESAYQVIDRKAMWKWLSALKQPDGGFQMCLGGEVDIRGAYCAAVIITLLNIPRDLSAGTPARAAGLSDLFEGLAGYVRRCQTYEGGISAQPDAEAHGAYAFCALGCLAILDAPSRIIPRVLNVPRLISWISSRQYAPEGGFSGRTNKLVDGCYSHWVGACWPLLQASLESTSASAPHDESNQQSSMILNSFYDREGLIRYILSCGQDHSLRGGMRDKPSHRADAYHTCYVLSGLTSAQHIVKPVMPVEDPVANVTWTAYPYSDSRLFDEQDRLEPTDPVYAMPAESREAIMAYFLSQSEF